jgi:ribonuclease HI
MPSAAPSSADPAGPDAPPVVAATDGSCLGNPGPGGWAWYVDETWFGAGAEAATTNNAMELRAVLELLAAVPPHRPLVVLADSSYVIGIATSWRHGWRRRGWRTAAGAPVANGALVRALDAALTGRRVVFEHVRGHSGHPLNEIVDGLARAEAAALAGRR